MPLAPHVLVELSKREVAARVDRTEQRSRCRRRLRLFRLAAVAFGVGDAQPAQVDERKKRRGELLRYMGLQGCWYTGLQAGSMGLQGGRRAPGSAESTEEPSVYTMARSEKTMNVGTAQRSATSSTRAK